MSGGAEDLDGNFAFDDANDTGSPHTDDADYDDDGDDDDCNLHSLQSLE
jgi:hypothetical protein